MGDYDRILKENIEAIFSTLLEKYLDISIAQSFEIKDKLQSTIEREPDFLKRIIDREGKEFILQLEFQTKNDPEMVYRISEYQAMIQRKYRLPVKSFVIYLGQATPTMSTQLAKEEQITGFELRNIREYATNKVLESDIPEEIILAILTDYPTSDTVQVVNQIISKLQKATRSESQLLRSIKQLLILSRLRKLDEVIEEKVENMPITYDISTDRLYLKGAEDNKYHLVKKALIDQEFSIEQIARVIDVTIDYVYTVQKEIEENK